MMHWRTHVAVVICHCVYSAKVKTDFKKSSGYEMGAV